MFNIEPIHFEEKTYKDLIIKKDLTPKQGKEKIFPHYSVLISKINEYISIAPKLETIKPLSTTIVNYTDDNLHDTLYSMYSTNKKLKQKIKNKCKKTKHANMGLNCPYCGIERHEMRDLDHFIPRKDYPEFSILSNNLIFICSKCNQHPNKGEQFLDTHGNRLFLNPYYDKELNTTQILDCNIEVFDMILKVNFKITDSLKINNNYLYVIASNHLKKLNLNKRYKKLIKRDLLRKIINRFIDKKLSKNFNKNIIKMISEKEAIYYIDQKIEELGPVSINNYELVFLKKLRMHTQWFINISGKEV